MFEDEEEKEEGEGAVAIQKGCEFEVYKGTGANT